MLYKRVWGGDRQLKCFGTPTLIQLRELEDSEASCWRACVSWGMRIRPTVFSSSSARVVSTHPLIDTSPDFPFRCLIGCLCIPLACLSVFLPGRKAAFNANALTTHESTYKIAKLGKKQCACGSLSAQDQAWVFPLPYFTTLYGNCTYEGATSY